MDNLVICAGVEHTGSTSLWYTLRENKIVHTGHFKQSKYLQAYEKKDNTIRAIFNQKRKMPFQPNRMNADVGEWTQDELDDFFDEEFSIDRYIEYYKRVIDKTGFPMAGDFSEYNAELSEDILYQLAIKLNNAFNVKVILLFRDPIIRWWHLSHCAAKKREEWFFKQDLQDNCFYAEIYRKWRIHFPNTHVAITEDLFAGHTDELSDFLGYPIKNVHRCAFVPYKGKDLPHYPELRCQWRSNARPLQYKEITPELYKHAEEAFEWVYEDCHAEGIYPKYSLNSWYM